MRASQSLFISKHNFKIHAKSMQNTTHIDYSVSKTYAKIYYISNYAYCYYGMEFK